jgi:hypothetical protein
VSAAELKPIVAELRRQRAGMVQTPDQYVFCYEVSLIWVDVGISLGVSVFWELGCLRLALGPRGCGSRVQTPDQ